MARFQGVDLAKATAKQREVATAMVRGGRGHATGLMGLWLHHADLAERTHLVGEFLRFKGTLPDAVRELIILLVAREWRCNHEWLVHAPIALKAGLPQAAIDAVRFGREPELQDPGQRAAYSYTVQLLQHHSVESEAFSKVMELWGRNGVIEIAALIGHYIIGAATLNAVEYDIPPGANAPFKL